MLPTIKAALGIAAADTTKDAAIARVLSEVMSAVETLLDRDLLQAVVTERYYDLDCGKLWLRRYPLQGVLSVDGQPPNPELVIHKRAGWIRDLAMCHAESVTVEYQGGYDITGTGQDPFPQDLERAILEAFMTKWASSDTATGAPTAAGGAQVVQGSGELKSLTLFDAARLEYDVGSSVVGGESASALASQQAYWGWLAPWASILQAYRRYALRA